MLRPLGPFAATVLICSVTPANAAEPKVDACSLTTAAAVGELLGSKTAFDVNNASGWTSGICDFAPMSAQKLQVEIIYVPYKKGYTSNLDMYGLQQPTPKDSTPVSNLGDHAVFTLASTTLYKSEEIVSVIKNGSIVSISIDSDTATPFVPKERLEAFAAQLIARF
jgi:hypothetical protein